MSANSPVVTDKLPITMGSSTVSEAMRRSSTLSDARSGEPAAGAITNGKVTGGTGSFAGATGTIKAKAISGTKHAVTITYST